MPALDNSKWERFARLVANGDSPTESYVSAGYSAASAHASASRLLKNATVCTRIAELRPRIIEIATQATGINKAWVISGLKKNYERAMQEEAVLDREGKETGEFVYQGTVANRSLELIGKELGMFVDRKDVTLRKALSELTDEEVDALIADAERKQASEATSGTVQ